MAQSAEWDELQRELEAVAVAAHAFNAYVFDVWDNLWCAAHGFSDVPREDVAKLIHAAAARRGVSLVRGGKLDTCISEFVGYVYLRTYGSCYVLLLRFPGPFDQDKARGAVTEALQRLEALTLRLPPPDGPGSDGNEAAGSA